MDELFAEWYPVPFSKSLFSTISKKWNPVPLLALSLIYRLIDTVFFKNWYSVPFCRQSIMVPSTIICLIFDLPVENHGFFKQNGIQYHFVDNR